MKPDPTKIFCIGLSKTGTSSLAAALDILGYRTKDYLGVSQYIPGDLDSSVDLSMIDSNDAFTDTPIPSFYQELDVRYPNSKFILTVRELKGWLNSCKKQFNQRATQKMSHVNHDQLFRDIYNTPFFEEEKFTQGYQRFKDDALDYFKNRPDDFLVIDICAGEGWEKICSFLGKPIPDVPFPKSNVTQIQWINTDNLIAIAKDAGQELLKEYAKITDSDSAANNGLTDWMRRLMHRDKISLLNKAINKSHESLIKGLQKLTPDIPVLSCIKNDVPYSERKSWNHVWLIDPLNGIDQYINGNDDFCLSFSLIQDGKPVYGVIYAPKTETTYYTKRGKGCYFKEGENTPVKLEKPVKDNDINTATILNQQQQNLEEVESYLKMTYPDLQQNIETGSLSSTLAFCRIAKGEAEILFIADSTREWETAAAHAILKELGKNIYDFETKNENRYNKPNLNNNRLVVQ